MDMDRIQEYYKNALLADLCQDYKGRWQKASHDKKELLKLAMCQQSIPHVVTFAYQGKGVTKEYVKENFADYINGYTIKDADGVKGYTYRLYAGYDYDNGIYADVDVASIMWTANTDVVMPQCKAATLYISNRSEIRLVCEGYNNVRIYLFDESTVTLDDVDEESSIIIYRYSDMAKVEVGEYCMSDNVRIFNKELRL